jgi:hypothetical protein
MEGYVVSLLVVSGNIHVIIDAIMINTLLWRFRICQSSKMFGFIGSRLFDEWSKMRSGIREKHNGCVEFEQFSITKYLQDNKLE